MRPLEILEQLNSYSTIRGIHNFLSKLDASNEFWCLTHYALQPFDEWKVPFAVSNPDQFGNGCPPNVIVKIIQGMETGNLKPEEFLIAIQQFARTCSQEEWEQWYRPALEREIQLPFGIDTFNETCPKKWKVKRWWEVSPFLDISKSDSFPKEFYIEPLMDIKNRAVWFCTPSGVRSFLYQTGTEFESPYIDQFKELAHDMNGGIILDGYLDDNLISLRDFLTFDEFFSSQRKSLALNHRYDVLSMIGEVMLDLQIDSVEVVEMLEGSVDDKDTTRKNINMLLEQGFNGVIIRDINGGFTEPSLVVNPEKESVLTCTNVSEEYITGRGMMNRKSFTANVYYGLTSDEKSQYSSKRDAYIGKKFIVVSNGRDQQGNVQFPIFKHWRT